MGQVLLALMPATLFGIYNFGIRALVIILITVISCVFFEAAFEKLTDRKNTIMDQSAALTGLLLALNLPADVPFPQRTPILNSSMIKSFPRRRHFWKKISKIGSGIYVQR